MAFDSSDTFTIEILINGTNIFQTLFVLGLHVKSHEQGTTDG